jgi:hypothetical protein
MKYEPIEPRGKLILPIFQNGITVGDKQSQSKDINFSSDFVRNLQVNQE